MEKVEDMMYHLIHAVSGGSWYFSLGGQVFEKLGVVENIIGSHTQKITLDSIISRKQNTRFLFK